MTLQKLFPILTSIGLILAAALLRDKSRVLAAVLATMPINVPLALWVVSSASNNDQAAMAEFVQALVVSLIPSWVWLGIVFLAVRAGWSLGAALSAGYAAWGGLLVLLFYSGVLRWPR